MLFGDSILTLISKAYCPLNQHNLPLRCLAALVRITSRVRRVVRANVVRISISGRVVMSEKQRMHLLACQRHRSSSYDRCRQHRPLLPWIR